MSSIGVRFPGIGKIYDFPAEDYLLEVGDHVIAETARGVEFGEVVRVRTNDSDAQSAKTQKKLMRKADENDIRQNEQNLQKEKEAFKVCEQRIRQRKMEMKLIDVKCMFDGGKILFYFTAEGRVDFRDLVKDLASVFRTRIELRQIGVRDEAKKVGGLGPCGRSCCCNDFLGDFQPVSIKMAKEQNLSLSPTKISGLCGRLMCCLNYEQEHYHEMRKKMPKNGSLAKTPDGEGEVQSANVLTGRIKVKMPLEDGSAEIKEYNLEELTILPKPKETSSEAHRPYKKKERAQRDF